MIKISILTPTVRPELIKINEECLKRQNFRDFEWIIAAPLPEKISTKNATVLKDPPKEKDDYWKLNSSCNQMIRRAKGELIVSYQDGIWIPYNGLEKFWIAYRKTGGCISGVGDIYESANDITAKVWNDPRKSNPPSSFYECYPDDIEFNWCAIPKKAFYEIGGFDEGLDKYAGMDNISVCERLEEAGYKFFLDQTNECRGQFHEKLPDWDKKHAMHGAYEQRKQELKEKGIWPVLPYLTKN